MATETNNRSSDVDDYFSGMTIFFRRKIGTIQTVVIGTLIVRIIRVYCLSLTIKENDGDNNNDVSNIILKDVQHNTNCGRDGGRRRGRGRGRRRG